MNQASKTAALAESTTCGASSPIAATTAALNWASCPWRITTPFGRPVEPEV